jgi:hypothetical protein
MLPDLASRVVAYYCCWALDPDPQTHIKQIIPHHYATDSPVHQFTYTHTHIHPMDFPPSYTQAIRGFVPPPTYQDVITVSHNPSMLPNAYSQSNYYNVDELDLMDIDELVDIYDDDVIAYFETGLADREPYQIKSDQELNDLRSGLHLHTSDKLVQIRRNISFIEKRIISRDLGYYIDQLRSSTIADFKRVESKVSKELSLIDNLIENYQYQNKAYIDTTATLQELESKLASFYKQQYQTTIEKPLIQSTILEIYQAHNKLNKCYHNLQIIESQVRKFSDTDDVSYVLKERARIYNDAKQVILNRQRLSA